MKELTPLQINIAFWSYMVVTGVIYAALGVRNRIKRTITVSLKDLICWFVSGGFAFIVHVFIFFLHDLWEWLDKIKIVRSKE